MWQMTLGGKSLRLDDLPPATYQQIANTYSLSWLDVFASPMMNLDAFCDLVRACAAHLEVPAPDLSTIRLVRQVGNDALERAEDDMPSEYEDGAPLAEDGSKTDTSSTSPAVSDGPPK